MANPKSEMDRRTLLKDLIAYRRPTHAVLEDLRRFPWDCDKPLLELTAVDLLAMLYQFCRHECSADDMELWADAIECRDDFGYDATSVTGSILHELANPLITQPLSLSRAWDLISRLRESGEVKIAPHFHADISLVSTAQGGREMALPSDQWKTILSIDGELWSAVLWYEGNPLPGSAFQAGVSLIYPSESLALFKVGTCFTVWEGRIKAEGCVTALDDSNE